MIKLENVNKVYRMGKVDVPALRRVSLSIEKGEMVGYIVATRAMRDENCLITS